MRFLGERTIGATVIAVLAVLPASGPLCVALCARAWHQEAAPGIHGEHATAGPCHDPSDGPAVTGAPGHDCSRHDGSAGGALAAPSAGRAGADFVRLAQHVAPSIICLAGMTMLPVHAGPAGPPGSVPPTRTPLVLRI